MRSLLLIALLAWSHLTSAQAQQARPKNNPEQPNLDVRVPVAPVKPAMTREQIEEGLKTRSHALYIKEGWIRDPYIVLGPDDFYYLTGTTPNDGDEREVSDPYNTGLGKFSLVGNTVRVWKSKDLIDWEYLGTPFTQKDSWHQEPAEYIWAPELHWLGDRWALIHCPAKNANLAINQGADLKGPWTHPLGAKLGDKHDPSLFNDNGQWWLLWGNTMIAPLNKEMTDFTATPVRIDPSSKRPAPNNPDQSITRIGHEGATMIKVGNKYVHIGTAWSTDMGRKGSYNLYFCTADAITGPYGPRQFVGRFLGHGTPFQTRDGKWWCTAFFNGNVPPIPSEGVQGRDLSDNAYSINQRGVTIVPLDVKVLENEEVSVRAIDPVYATPGPDEAQAFE